jgi:hypothetical protein
MNETGNGGVSTEENDKLRNKLIGSWTVNQSAQHVMYLFDDRQAGRWLEDGHTERSFAYEVISANIETLTMIIKFDSGSSFHHKQFAFSPDFQSLKAKISISGPSGPFGISEYWDKLSNLSMIHPEGRAS